MLLCDPREFRALVDELGPRRVASVLRKPPSWVETAATEQPPLWALVLLRRAVHQFRSAPPGFGGFEVPGAPAWTTSQGDGQLTGALPAWQLGSDDARPRVLLVGGSLNQTRMMHRIAEALGDDAVCAFSSFYADGYVRWLAEHGHLDTTILGGQAKAATQRYFREHGLPVDERGEARTYDLVVMGTDLVVPDNVRATRFVLVQEGMTDPEGWLYRLTRTLGLPRYLANTSMTGLSHAYDAFCVAGDGWKDKFVAKGCDPERLVVTGMPNFDDCAAYLDNDFPHHGYVLAATSCLRETFKYEDRDAFILRAKREAEARGRRLLFKLHPNEDHARAVREIEALAPEALVFTEGNTDHMIANCDVLVTRYSSVVLVAAALEKTIVSDLDAGTLRQLRPVQNGGTSAHHIADVCRQVLDCAPVLA
ncbi:MAG: hypothetical protein AAF809_10730 [Bacteroidota bacterium]